MGTIAQDALGVDALSVGDVNGDGNMIVCSPLSARILAAWL